MLSPDALCLPQINTWNLLRPGEGRWLRNGAPAGAQGNDGFTAAGLLRQADRAQRPPPREQHSASLLKGKMLVFGGVSSSGDDSSPHQDALHRPEGSLLQPRFKNGEAATHAHTHPKEPGRIGRGAWL